MTSPYARTREQTQRGLNLCPISRSQRGKAAAAKSPWSKGPHSTTARAREVYERNNRERIG